MTAEGEAFWFGRERPRCFGMLHRPGTAATGGVVICNGLGYEGLIACRPLADLASRLVALGYTVLRFDYEGAGDSDGGDWEPERTKEWLESIDEAVGVLHAREGIKEVYLAGIRIGASLACLYAHDHPGIAGLALWAPCADGAAYVRELRALSQLSAAARPQQRVTADWFPKDSLEVAGFELARPTAEDLRRINLVEYLGRPPAPAALVVDHAHRPSADALVQRLLDLGTKVEHVRVPGYAEFMADDEVKSVLPVEALDELADWFARARPVQKADQPLADPVGTFPPDVSRTLVVGESALDHCFPPRLGRPRVVENTVRLPGGLFSIVTEPVDQRLRRQVAVVILNTGLTNRVGQGRLSAGQARYWASLGFTVVRVDLGGTGDSPMAAAGDSPMPGTGDSPMPATALGTSIYAPERVDETIRIADWLHVHGNVDRVVLYGICSGAHHSFHAALRGGAVASAILVNPAVWYNDGYRKAGMEIHVARNSMRAIFRPDEWRRLLREPRATLTSIKQAARGFNHLVRVKTAPRLRRFGFDLSDPVALARDLTQIDRHDVNVLIVFAAAEIGEQYLRTFGGETLYRLQREGKLKIVNIDGGDHVFSAPGARQRLVDVVTRYLEDIFPHPREGVKLRGDQE